MGLGVALCNTSKINSLSCNEQSPHHITLPMANPMVDASSSCLHASAGLLSQQDLYLFYDSAQTHGAAWALQEPGGGC